MWNNERYKDNNEWRVLLVYRFCLMQLRSGAINAKQEQIV